MLNYLQVIALAGPFSSMERRSALALEVQGAVSTLGDHIVNVDCISTSNTAAELFYETACTWSSVIMVSQFLSGSAMGFCRVCPSLPKRAEKNMRTPKDKFIVTVTAVIFLVPYYVQLLRCSAA